MLTDKKFFPVFKIYSPDDLSKDWFIYWIVDGVRHKRKTGINSFSTYEERMAAALKLKGSLESSVGLGKALADLMVDWVEERRGMWREKTYLTRKSKVGCFLVWVGDRKISNDLVKAFFVKIAGELHGKTVSEYRAWLNAVFVGLGRGDLMDGVEVVKYESVPAQYFQRHQVKKIEKYLLVHDVELWLFCRFIYFCFIRPGELRMLRVGDIEFDDWKICVRGEVAKNRKTQRVVIPVRFRDAVVKYMSRPANEFLFFREDGSIPLAENAMNKRFRAVLTKLGYGLEYKLYSWKHTGAVALVRAGVHPKWIQLQLRHSTLEETDGYLRQLGFWDLGDLADRFPAPGEEG